MRAEINLKMRNKAGYCQNKNFVKLKKTNSYKSEQIKIFNSHKITGNYLKRDRKVR